MTDKFTLVAVYLNADGEAKMDYRDFGSWVTLYEAKKSFAESTGARFQNVFTLEEFNSVTEIMV